MSAAVSLLSVDGLTTRFRTPHGAVTAVNDVSFDLQPGRWRDAFTGKEVEPCIQEGRTALAFDGTLTPLPVALLEGPA